MPSLRFTLLIACTLATLIRAVELPTDTQIAEAQERGTKIRTQTELLPDALLKCAVILKTGNERCGHDFIQIEDAKNEGGAKYKFTERFRIVTPREKIEALYFTHVSYLAADFTVINGRQVCTSTINENGQRREELLSVEFELHNDMLKLRRKQKIGNEEEKALPAGETKLFGVRPLPGKAIAAMPAFAAKDATPLSGGINPFMISTLHFGWTDPSFSIQSAWLTFEKVNIDKSPIKLHMTARYFDAELSPDGLLVDRPTEETWDHPQVWSYDEKLKILALPAPPDSAFTAEVTDPDKLDFDAPLDREKIKAATPARQ